MHRKVEIFRLCFFNGSKFLPAGELLHHQWPRMRLLRFLVVPCAVVAQFSCVPLTKISVSTEQDAADLAAAAICKNATLSALWSGSVQPTTTIVVGKGTSLTINGTGGAEIDGGDVIQLFNIQGLRDLTLSNANSTSFGAAVNGTAAQISAYNTTFQRNTSKGAGGAVSCVDNCSLLLVNCTFNSNLAKWGGSVYVGENSTLTMSDTAFSNSMSTTEGGGVYTYSSTGTISTSKFIDCGSSSNGAGVFMQEKSNVSLIDCEFIDNSCVDAGAGVYCKAGSRLDVSSGTFKNNLAEFGSAIHVADSDTTANVTTSTFTDNVVTKSGGAIYSGSKNLSISTSVFNNNSADIGGAILCSDLTSTVFVGNSFSNNRAYKRYGGM
jgi:predicted outer membrane repeat protein